MTFTQEKERQSSRNKAAKEVFSLFPKDTVFRKVQVNTLVNYHIKDKPEFIKDELWDLVFCKLPLYSMFSDIYAELYVGIIDEYLVGIEQPGIFYLFKTDSIDLTNYNTINKLSASSLLNQKTVLNNLETLYNTAKEIYGEDNVCIESGHSNPDLKPLYRYPTNSNANSILILHKPFWIRDQFGIAYKLEKPVSRLNVSASNSIRFDFIDLQPDAYMFDKMYNHSHIYIEEDGIYLKSVCKGSGSPINSALGAYLAIPSEDTAYNLFINYNNLLEQESEQGGPYKRMRKILFNTSRSSVRHFTKNELTNLIKTKKVKVSVNISDSIKVKINKDSIISHVSSLKDGNSNDKINTFDNQSYKVVLEADSVNGEEFFSFIFKDRLIECKSLDFNPDRFDFSDIENNPYWVSSCVSIPPNGFILELENSLSDLLTNHLISNKSTIKAFNYDKNFPKELFGIKEVSGRTNIDSLF